MALCPVVGKEERTPKCGSGLWHSRMIFMIALGEPAEGNIVEGVPWSRPAASGALLWLSTPPCSFCPGEWGSPEGPGGENKRSTIWPELKEISLLCFLSWLHRLPTQYQICLPKVEPARALSSRRPIQLSLCRARQNKQCLYFLPSPPGLVFHDIFFPLAVSPQGYIGE